MSRRASVSHPAASRSGSCHVRVAGVGRPRRSRAASSASAVYSASRSGAAVADEHRDVGAVGAVGSDVEALPRRLRRSGLRAGGRRGPRGARAGHGRRRSGARRAVLLGPSGAGPRMKASWKARSEESSSASASEARSPKRRNSVPLPDSGLDRDRIHGGARHAVASEQPLGRGKDPPAVARGVGPLERRADDGELHRFDADTVMSSGPRSVYADRVYLTSGPRSESITGGVTWPPTPKQQGATEIPGGTWTVDPVHSVAEFLRPSHDGRHLPRRVQRDRRHPDRRQARSARSRSARCRSRMSGSRDTCSRRTSSTPSATPRSSMSPRR